MKQQHVDRALVLDRIAYGDHDLVLSVLTRSAGRLSLFARGARRRQPRFGAALDHHCLIEAEWRPPRTGTLGVLQRADLLDDHRGLRADLDALLVAGFASEAVRETCPEAAAVTGVFELLAALLARLARPPGSIALWLAFQLQLLDQLGFAPELDHCVGCGTVPPPGKSVLVDLGQGGIVCRSCRQGAATGLPLTGAGVELLRRLRELPLDTAELPEPDPEARQQLRVLLPQALQQILGRPLKSLSLLRF